MSIWPEILPTTPRSYDAQLRRLATYSPSLWQLAPDLCARATSSCSSAIAEEQELVALAQRSGASCHKLGEYVANRLSCASYDLGVVGKISGQILINN